jgi:VanZ family protein
VKARLLFVTAVLAQLAALYWPSAPELGPLVPFADKIVHVAVFGVAVWTGRRAGVPVWALVVIFAVHAGLSEVLQDRLLDDRAGDWGDVVADLAGIVLGSVLPRTRVGYRSAEKGAEPGSMGSGTTNREGRDDR